MRRTTSVLIVLLLAFATVALATPTVSATHICANMTPVCEDPEATLFRKVVCRFVYWPWACEYDGA